MSVRDLATGVWQTLDLIGTALPKPALRKVADATAALVHARSVNTSGCAIIRVMNQTHRKEVS